LILETQIRCPGGNIGIEFRRKLIIGFKTKTADLIPDVVKLRWIGARFNNGRNKPSELYWRPAIIARQFDMDEIKPEKVVIRILDTAKHMGTALAAVVTLYRCGSIHDFEPFLVFGDAEFVAGHNSDL
tara:strand:- start:954 stop:1337 length:384 start_codon:yes stop_codon:yes gene_type:complete